MVILGLLTGGILTGQSLIRAAELRAVTQQYQQLRTAIYTFRDKYFQLPGDMTNATAFWGAADAGDGLGNDCYDIESTDKTTCNGNGDGIIKTPSSASALHLNEEEFRAWQHLANAGLISGSYTGRTDDASKSLARTAGKNTPNSKFPNSGVRIFYLETGASQYFTGVSYNIHMFKMGGSLTTEEAWSIDVKIDDGSPVYGKFIEPRSDAPWLLNCTTTTDAATSEYNLTDTSSSCAIFFKIE